MSDNPVENRMEVLIGAYIDGSIDENGAEELLLFLRTHPEWNVEVANQIFTEVDLRSTNLFDDVVDGLVVSHQEFSCDCAPVSSKTVLPAQYDSHRIFGFSSTAILLLAVLSVFGAVLYGIHIFTNVSNVSGQFASISRTTNCLWGDSQTRTSPGTRLGACTLRLEQGIALIHFDCGVAVSLEGPSVFELKDKKYGVLHSGRLVAMAETIEGQGFIVDTPDSSIKDLGTKFAVYAPKDAPSEVHVLEGTVEVRTRELEKTHLLEKGETMTIGVHNGNGKHNGSFMPGFQISTAMGRGKEAWVISRKSALQATARHFPKGISEPYMLVKTEIPNEDSADRKTIFCLDLTILDDSTRKNFTRSELFLSYGPTEIGYASNIGDATFTVYGLLDENRDDWNETTIDWQSFPGNGERNTLDASVWNPLGTFEIKQGSRTGMVRIDDPRLAEFLKRDTNGLATFAVVCDTYANESYSIVFGFANRHHTELQPPRLFLSH